MDYAKLVGNAISEAAFWTSWAWLLVVSIAKQLYAVACKNMQGYGSMRPVQGGLEDATEEAITSAYTSWLTSQSCKELTEALYVNGIFNRTK